MPKVIAFIPARGGSKSIPLKNIKNFAGKPLIYWCLKAAQDCPLINQTVLATDSNQIKKIALDFNFNKTIVFNRSKENSSDTASTESVLLEFIYANNFNSDDIIILIQATSPFITGLQLQQAIKQLQLEGADSLLSVVPFKRFIWQDKTILAEKAEPSGATPVNYTYTQRPRRQDFNGYYIENGAFYINTVQNILETKNRLSKKISLFIMPEYTSIELDEPLDWKIAEQIFKLFTIAPK